jgi:hypothetical protein
MSAGNRSSKKDSAHSPADYGSKETGKRDGTLSETVGKPNDMWGRHCVLAISHAVCGQEKEHIR